jgi:Chaperone of endosialidase
MQFNNPLQQKKQNMTTRRSIKSIGWSPLRLGFLLIPIALACFAVLPTAQAVVPAPDGGYPGNNTAEGEDALFSLTTGTDNTAMGFHALYSNTTGSLNTANGVEALHSNTTGLDNTANGWEALFSNTTANGNTANGADALFSNTTGAENTANGATALFSNTTGFDNTANGFGALFSNTTGNSNTANGVQTLSSNTIGIGNTANGVNALLANTTGNYNTANGRNALLYNTTGVRNTAEGVQALLNNTGSNNTGLGYNAGSSLTTGSGNVCIGQGVLGVAGENNTTRIKNVYASVASARAVYVNSNNKIGTLVSSRRFKEEIKLMDEASKAILALKPVTFRYKKDVEPNGAIMFGLIAEEVEQVDPELVTRNDKGEAETVRYDAVNAMLLNEFLKEHRTVQELKSNAAKQEATIAKQQKQIEALTAGLQRVSAQVELNKLAPQTVKNDD